MKIPSTKILILSLLLVFMTDLSFSNQSETPDRVYGVTIDAVNNLNKIIISLSNLNVKPTTRIVFDEWQPATDYSNAVNQIHNVSFIMGEIIDSYYMHEYSVNQYKNRIKEYIRV